MTSHPPEDEWTAEDLANQRKTAFEVGKALERHHTKMVLWIGAVGIALALAIHFLSTP